jgi:hypothetical protein
MLTKLHEGEAYRSRPASSIPVPLSLDPETATLLERLAPGQRGRSKFVTRLIHAEVARRDERQRLGRLLEVAQDGEQGEDSP